MADSVAEKGYAKTVVADVLARAGVSRATFYELFRDKDDCFRATYEWAASTVASALAEMAKRLRAERRGREDYDPIEQVDRLLDAYLHLLAGAPSLARTFLVEVYAAGPAAVEQRAASLEAFVDLVAEALGDLPGPLGNRPEQRFALRLVLGGISSMVTHLVGTGRAEELPALREPLIALLCEVTGLQVRGGSRRTG